MMDSKIDGLTVLEARRGAPYIETDVATHEIAAMLAAGEIVIIKGVFDPAEMRRVRAAIVAAAMPDSGGETQASAGKSFRIRRDDHPDAKLKGLFDTYFFAMNDPADRITPQIRAPFDRLAAYWRALTGCTHDFVPDANGQTIRPWAMYYPSGGGYLDWHVHPPGPTKIGLIAAMSEIGVDFQFGATEFKTPAGVINTATWHDIGDVCLFGYEMSHRVSPVDPDHKLSWDGAGRWTLITPVQ